MSSAKPRPKSPTEIAANDDRPVRAPVVFNVPLSDLLSAVYRQVDGQRRAVFGETEFPFKSPKALSQACAVSAEAGHHGHLHLVAGDAVVGIRLAFLDPAMADEVAGKLSPSLRLSGPEGQTHFVYLLSTGSVSELSDLIGDLNEDAPEGFSASDKMPLPYGPYELSADDVTTLESDDDFAVYTLKQFEDALFDADGDEPEMRADDLPALIPTDTLNDAEVYGAVDPEIKEHEIEYASGKNRRAPVWSTKKTTIGKFIDRLSRHPVSEDKDGRAFIPGALVGKARADTDVSRLHMMVIDSDSGRDFDTVCRRILETGLLCVAWTTYSHGSTRVKVALKKYATWCAKKGGRTAGYDQNNPTVETFREYLEEESNYDPDVIALVRSIDVDQIEGGMHVIATTRPIDKFRIVVFLEKPWARKDRVGKSDVEVKAEWAGKLRGMAAHLGVTIDESTLDLARLHYQPSHPPQAEDFKIRIFAGRLVDWEEIAPVERMARNSGDPFATAGDDLTGRKAIVTPNGRNLRQWVMEGGGNRADTFDFVRLFDDHAPEEYVYDRRNDDRYTVKCPYDEDHSVSGPEDAGCYVVNSGHEVKSDFRCSHNSCKTNGHSDRLVLLNRGFELGWWPESVLDDPQYELDLNRYNAMVEEKKKHKDTVASYDKAMKLVEKVTPESATSDIDQVFDLCLDLREFDRERVFSALAKKLKMQPATVRNLFVAIAEAKAARLPEDSPYAFLNGTGFGYDSVRDPVHFYSGDSAVCQTFEVVGHCEDAIGDNATLTLRFEAMGKVKVKELRRRDMYSYGSPAIADLAAMNFKMPNVDATLDLLKAIDTPLTGQWVRRRGWHGDSFLSISGETFSPEGSDTLPLHMLGTDRKPAGANGTLEGWQNAVAPIWEDNAAGREHMALALMAGMAGPAFGKCKPDGFRMLSFHGPTSRGKSLALKLMASVAWPPTTEGCYLTLRATSNGIEVLLPDLSGHAIALDEGQHMKAEDANSLVFMLEDGSGKITSTRDRGARERSRFGGGIVVMANEKPWTQKLRDAKVDVSPGFDARVMDISVAGVKDYPKKEATPLTTQLHGVMKHNGHALPLIVEQLLKMDPADIERKIARMTEAIVGSDALGLEARALETLAWVWLGGMLGKKAGLIPPDFSLGRIIRWARDNRVADASNPVNERVLASLRTAIARRRKVDLYKWETFDPDTPVGPLPDDVERVNRPVAGYFYNAQGGEELIILADALREMTGSICSETEVAQYLHEAGYLRKSGKNLYHDKLPMRDGHADRVKNYRIKRGFYSSEKDDDADEAS